MTECILFFCGTQKSVRKQHIVQRFTNPVDGKIIWLPSALSYMQALKSVVGATLKMDVKVNISMSHGS